MIHIQNRKQELFSLRLVYPQFQFRFPFLNDAYRRLPPAGVDRYFQVFSHAGTERTVCASWPSAVAFVVCLYATFRPRCRRCWATSQSAFIGANSLMWVWCVTGLNLPWLFSSVLIPLDYLLLLCMYGLKQLSIFFFCT